MLHTHRFYCTVVALASALQSGVQASSCLPTTGCNIDGTAQSFIDPQSLTRQEIVLIQDALIWSDHYNGLKDGGWGRSTQDGIRAWLVSSGFPPAVSIHPQEMEQLYQTTNRLKAEAQWTLTHDNVAGVWFGYPAALVSLVIANQPGHPTTYAGSGITLQVSFEVVTSSFLDKRLDQQATDPTTAGVDYRISRADRKVLSFHTKGNVQTYLRYDRLNEGWAELLISLPMITPSIGRLITAASADFNVAATDSHPDPSRSTMPTLYPILRSNDQNPPPPPVPLPALPPSPLPPTSSSRPLLDQPTALARSPALTPELSLNGCLQFVHGISNNQDANNPEIIEATLHKIGAYLQMNMETVSDVDVDKLIRFTTACTEQFHNMQQEAPDYGLREQYYLYSDSSGTAAFSLTRLKLKRENFRNLANVPTCDNSDILGQLQNAVVNGPAGRRGSLELLDVKDFRDLTPGMWYWPSTVKRYCQATALLNTGERAINYQLSRFRPESQSVTIEVQFR